MITKEYQLSEDVLHLFVQQNIFSDDDLDKATQLLIELCQRWQISEFIIFGSLLRSDFKTSSDIDCLITFMESAPWDLFEIVSFKDELKELFNREIDLTEKKSLTNPFILKSITENHKVLYSNYG